MVLFKKAELILDVLSISVEASKENQLANLELIEMNKIKVDKNHDHYELTGNRVTVSLDHADLDEIIAILQDASNHLKKEV